MALSSATRRRNHPPSRLVRSGWSLNHCQAHSTCASEPSDNPSAKLTARYPAMRSGSSLRLSGLLKLNPSVVDCFIGTKPFSCELWLLCDTRSCAIMLVLTCFCRALSPRSRKSKDCAVRHRHRSDFVLSPWYLVLCFCCRSLVCWDNRTQCTKNKELRTKNNETWNSELDTSVSQLLWSPHTF